MPAFTQHLRRVSGDFKAKLRRQSNDKDDSVFEDLDEDFDAGYAQSTRASFPNRLAIPSAADYGVLKRVPTGSFALQTPPLCPEDSPWYSPGGRSGDVRRSSRGKPSMPPNEAGATKKYIPGREHGLANAVAGIQAAPDKDNAVNTDPADSLPSTERTPPLKCKLQAEGESPEHSDLVHSRHVGSTSRELPHQTSKVHACETSTTAPGPGTELEVLVSRLPAELWVNVARYLTPLAAASFALANGQTARLVGGEFWSTLNRPENKQQKISFLEHMDDRVALHVLCYECTIFHHRMDPGNECLRESYRRKPIVKCMRQVFIPSVRLSLDRSLPFVLAQLVMRGHRHGPAYGVPVKALNRTWQPVLSDCTTSTEWTHRTHFLIDKGQLLMKVTSMHFVPSQLSKSGQVLALTCRKDYTANYSTCAHEAHGLNLFSICKCALKHIQPGAAARMPSQCATCRPLKRCIACPTEYLVEVKLKEDKSGGIPQFRPAIIVSRWTNLGDCMSPASKEWKACSSLQDLTDDDDFELYCTDDVKTVRSRYEAASGARPSEVRARPLRRFSSHADHRERELMRDDGRRIALFMRGY